MDQLPGRPRLLYVVTHPMTARHLLRGQPSFMREAGFAPSISNLGTAIRHRAKMAPILLILASGLPYFQRLRRRRRRAARLAALSPPVPA